MAVHRVIPLASVSLAIVASFYSIGCSGDESDPNVGADTSTGDVMSSGDAGSDSHDGSDPADTTTDVPDAPLDVAADATADSGSDTGSDPDVESDATGTDDASEDVIMPPLQEGTFVVRDLLTGLPVSGMALTSDSAEALTDDNGEATVGVAASAGFHVVGKAAGYHDSHLYGYVEDADFQFATQVVSNAGADLVAQQLGVTLDSGKGVVVVDVFRYAGIAANYGPLFGATVDLDVAYDAVYAFDGDGAVPLSPGNVTAGDRSTLVFFNVTSGTVNVTVTPPAGYGSCAAFPSLDTTAAIGSHADAVTHVRYSCLSPTATAKYTLIDFLTQAPIENVALTGGQSPVSTDSDGKAAVVVDTWAGYHLTGVREGYHDAHWYGYNDGGGYSGTYQMVSTAATALLASQLGITLDPNKGIVIVSAAKQSSVDSSLGSLAGATIDINVGYDLALVLDSGSPLGMSPGNKTLPGSPATVVFVNVDAGGFVPAIIPPEGYTGCTVFPGDKPLHPMYSNPNGASYLSFTCESPAATGQFTLIDFLTSAPIEGVALTAGAEPVLTDAEGLAPVVVDTWGPYHVVGTKDGYHTTNWYGYNDGSGFSGTYQMVSNAASATLAAGLGITLDPNKGIVLVSASKKSVVGSKLTSLGGTTIDIDASYDVALAMDDAAPLGFSLGNVTVPGSPATIVFVNVSAGPVTASLTLPEGYDGCTVFPGELEQISIESSADGISFVSYTCTSPSANAKLTVTDYTTTEPLEGMALTGGSEAATTDTDGEADLTVDTWGPYHITGELDGYHDIHWYGYNDGQGFATGTRAVSHTTSATLAGALGLTLDQAKGFVFATVFWQSPTDGTLDVLAGATVALDAAFDVALVLDANSPVGLSPGTTTLDGSPSTVVFINTDAGPFTPTVTPPAGYGACTVFPGNETDAGASVWADGITTLSFICKPIE